MKEKIVFATGNPNKVKEVNEVLQGKFEIVSLKEIGCTEELPETNPTLEENALQKARYVHDKFGVDCFSEDTGLEVEALNGEPGVYSARYAGPDKKDDANMNLLLKNLEGQSKRKARFRTVIALIKQGEEYLFEGIVNGQIAQTKSGTMGFGYDPLFLPEGYDRSFANMNAREKGAISHRGRAMQKLIAFLLGELKTSKH